MATLNTFYTSKCLRDATGALFIVLISSDHNPIAKVNFADKGIVSVEETSILSGGFSEIVIRVTSSVTATNIVFDLTFKDRQTVTGIAVVPDEKSQSLAVPFDALTRSFSVTPDAQHNTYNFVDLLEYPRESQQKQTVIYPSSRQTYLDTSDRSDFYYLSSGGFAYILSGSLQNEFLNNIKYTVKGETADTLGKFKGASSSQSLQILASPVTDSSPSDVKGPLVFGEVNVLDILVLNSDINQVRVCKDPAAANYYLIGCENNSYPCTDDGSAHAEDCGGDTLTSNIINNSLVIDEACCTVGCEGFSVNTSPVNQSAANVTNGQTNVTISNGDTNYTVVVTSYELDSANDPGTVYSTATTTETTDSFTISSLYAGTYTIQVTDTNGCTGSSFFSVKLKGDGNTADNTYGCKTSAAINTDSGATNDLDELCIFCNATTGLLESLGRNTFEDTWVNAGLSVATAASSDPVGVDINNGTLTIPTLDFPTYTIWNAGGDQEYTFSVSEYFDTSNQASPYTYKTYRLNISAQDYSAGNSNALNNGASTLSFLTSNATLVDTSTNSNGGSIVVTGLAPGVYITAIQYNNDGTLDGNVEVEQCYVLTRPVPVSQGGCTDPEANNYNESATFSDGSCNYDDTDTEDCTGEIILKPTFECADSSVNGPSIIFTYQNALDTNPALMNAVQNGFTFTQGENAGTFVGPTASNQSRSSNTLEFYIFSEIFCHDNTNNVGYLPYSIDFEAIGNTTDPTYYQGNVNINSNGDNANTIETQFIIVNTTFVFADGFEITTPSSLSSFLNPNSNAGISLGANLISQHGGLVSTSYSYNFGTFNVWEYTYQSEPYVLSQEEIDLINDCVLDTPSSRECTDATATNYCCPIGSEGIVSDNSLCIYEEEEEEDIVGCMDITATNYNAAATIADDSLCIYPELGKWVCKTPGNCNYEANAVEGYATEAECIQNCAGDDPTDCDELNTFVNDSGYTLGITSTNAPTSYTTLDSNQEPCGHTGPGSVTITIPSVTELNNNIDNPLGVYYYILATSYDSIADNIIYTGSFMPGAIGILGAGGFQIPGSGEYLDAATNPTHTLNLDPGGWNLSVIFTTDAYTNSAGLVNVSNVNCNESFNDSVLISKDDCNEDVDPVIYGCTDPNAENYNASAGYDDDSCTYPCLDCNGECPCLDGTYSVDCCPPVLVSGCTDNTAVNFDVFATYPCNDNNSCCQYPTDNPGTAGTSVIPACIPSSINEILDYNAECISRSGNRFYTKLLTGLADDCSTMEAWKMIIIQEILSVRGLPCIYNCSDSGSPALSDVITNCEEVWTEGGAIIWSPVVALSLGIGSSVQRDGKIFIAVSSSGLDIDPLNSISTNTVTTGWKLCTNVAAPADNSDYLEKFISFARSYCKDCGIPPYLQETQQNTEVSDDFTIGGSSLTNNGVSFGDE